jgi:hypothetical protein
MTTDAWCCPNPWDCHNHTPHVAPANCVHIASWCADAHDTSEADDQ